MRPVSQSVQSVQFSQFSSVSSVSYFARNKFGLRPKTLIFHRFWKDFGFKKGPRGDSRHSRGAALIYDPPFFDRSPPTWPQERPEGSQERPKSAQEGPKRPQDAPKRPPRGLQDTPKRSQEAPKMAQDGSKSEKARKQKTLIFIRFWTDFGL